MPTLLDRPPNAQVATLPRAVGDKPQEITLAVNPNDARNAVVSYQQADGPGSDHHPGIPVRVKVAWTADGGAGWEVVDASHPGYRVSIDAHIAYGPNDVAYLVYIGMDSMSFGAPTTKHGEYLLRSRDGGRTWSAPVALVERAETHGGNLDHFPQFAIDPRGGTAYVMWDLYKLDGTEKEAIVVRTADDGETWSAPRSVGTHPIGGHSAVVGPDGTVYAAYGLWPDDDVVIVATSRDGGETFSEGVRALELSEPMRIHEFPRNAVIPTLGVDASGTLYLVCGDSRHGDRDVFVVSSHDGGSTWSEPVRVNDDAVGNGRDQAMETLAVDPADGSVYVLFYDRRGDDENLRAAITLARSTDGGRTWANYAWSDVASDPRVGCLGEYLGLGALDGKVYAAWVENAPGEVRSGTPFEAGPGEMTPSEPDFPWGPTLIRVATADFSA